MKTILITGCSSGFGLDAAKHFLERGWNVVATMRTPQAGLLPASDRLRVLRLDVTDPDSIAALAAESGPIDVLVNNAGFGWLNALEGTPMDMARQLFETNTLGPMALIQAFAPQFRARGGVIVNVSSSVTLKPLPLLSAYTASKAALNAFTECLALEMAPFGVRVRLILPGRSPETKFGDNARARMLAIPEPYQAVAQRAFAGLQAEGPITQSSQVVEALWAAANEEDGPLRIPAGDDAVALASQAPSP